jgi:hypothetical protein
MITGTPTDLFIIYTFPITRKEEKINWPGNGFLIITGLSNMLSIKHGLW